MFQLISHIVLGMATLRFISGLCEITAAFLMVKFNTVEKAILINSGLALIGPIILITTTSIGLLGIAQKVPFGKLVWILVGIGCIIIGIRKG